MEKAKRNAQTKDFRIVPVLLAILLVFPAISWAGQFIVIKVYDGDTVLVDKMGKKYKIRLVGIDAPEDEQPFSKEATKYLTNLCLNHTVDIKAYGNDQYRRTLGVLILFNTTDAGLKMIEAGFAEVYRGRPPKGLNLDSYRKAESEARKKKRGMWSLGKDYVSPMEWRRGVRK